MAYKGFTWSVCYGDMASLKDLLERYVIDDPKFHYRIDRRAAALLIAKMELCMEVTPDGCSPTHGTADA